MEVTHGTLLGGQVHYRQPRDGYRTGIEPVLLAASVPAQPGQVVIEAGTGAGAGLMCLATRVRGIVGIGVELDPAMADLARANIEANALAGLSVMTGDVLGAVLPMADHAMANPPWHDAASTASPVGRRRLAKQEEAGVEAWVAALGRVLRRGGSLTMVLPPDLAVRAVAACELAGLGGIRRHALLAKSGRAAKMLLVQAWRGGSGAEVTSHLVLHEADGAFTDVDRSRCLRHGAASGGLRRREQPLAGAVQA